MQLSIVKILSSILVALLFNFICAFGQTLDGPFGTTHQIDSLEQLCLDTCDQSTAGMRECVELALEAWDTELNRVYGLLLENLSTNERTHLRDAQRAWLAWRDKEIEFIYAKRDNTQGTMWQLVAASEVMHLTRDRVLQLQAQLDNFETR